MDLLNDDCIHEVCEHLGLQEQINMALASQDFKNALQPLWQRSYAVLEIAEVQNLTNFEFFIKSIQGTIKKLTLSEDTKDLKRILSEMHFPNVETVRMLFLNTKANTFDELVLLIANCCPNIVELRLAGDITGRNICQLQKLERIWLSCTPEVLDCAQTKEVFKNLKLKKVSVSKSVNWDDWEYSGIATDEFFHQFLLCETIEELYFDGDFIQERYLDLMITRLKQLRKLAFFEWYPRVNYNYIRGCICESVYGLIIKSLRDADEVEGLLSLLSRLKNLEMLSLSEVDIDLNFLRQIIQNRVNRRPFIIYCHKTRVTESDLKLLRKTLPDWITVTINHYEDVAFHFYDVKLLLKTEATNKNI